MSLSNITSSLSQLFLQTQGSRTAETLLPSSPSLAAATLAARNDALDNDVWSSDPAYTLALGQSSASQSSASQSSANQQADRNTLLGYGQLAKRVRQTDDALSDIAHAATTNHRAVDGQGRSLVTDQIDPFGRDRAIRAARTLTDAVNALIGEARRMTADQGELARDQGPASTLAPAVKEVLQRDFSAGGRFTNLAGIGLAVAEDGTVALDTDALAGAYADDPHATRTLLARAASALHQTLAAPDADAVSGQITQRMRLLTQAVTKTPSLLDVLGSSATDSDTSGSWSAPSLSPALATSLAASSYAAGQALGQTASSQTTSTQTAATQTAAGPSALSLRI